VQRTEGMPKEDHLFSDGAKVKQGAMLTRCRYLLGSGSPNYDGSTRKSLLPAVYSVQIDWGHE